MLIEQIIEHQLRGPGPPGPTYTSETGYLKIFKWIIIYC